MHTGCHSICTWDSMSGGGWLMKGAVGNLSLQFWSVRLCECIHGHALMSGKAQSVRVLVVGCEWQGKRLPVAAPKQVRKPKFTGRAIQARKP